MDIPPGGGSGGYAGKVEPAELPCGHECAENMKIVGNNAYVLCSFGKQIKAVSEIVEKCDEISSLLSVGRNDTACFTA